MHTFVPVVFFVAFTVGEVLSSKFHGPTALPVVLHNGYLADTHEVAAAKSAHLATLSQQSHGGSYGHQGDSHYTQHAGHHGDLRYNGPITTPHVLHDGHIADTHEVAAAKAEHYAAIAKARAHGGYHHGGDYSGQYAAGNVADTQEVAAAKAEHFAAVAKARAHGGYNYGGDYSGQYAAGNVADTQEVAAAKAEHFAAVAKARAHGGYHYGGDYSSGAGHIADTKEVAAAKAEHFAAVAKARSLGGYPHGEDHSGQYDHYSGASGAYHGYGTHSSYHGALAKPMVLPSGYLADTVEVAHAKQLHHHLVHSSHSKHHY